MPEKGAEVEVVVDVLRQRQHTSAYISISQHTPAYASIRQQLPDDGRAGGSGRGLLEAASAYVSIRQHTSVYVSMRVDVSIRQHTSAYVSKRQQLPDYGRGD